MELKRIRTQKGLSQADVANGIDVSTTVYARYERGEREPSIEMLLRLSQFFDAPIDHLLGNKDTALSSFTKTTSQNDLVDRPCKILHNGYT